MDAMPMPPPPPFPPHGDGHFGRESPPPFHDMQPPHHNGGPPIDQFNSLDLSGHPGNGGNFTGGSLQRMNSANAHMSFPTSVPTTYEGWILRKDPNPPYGEDPSWSRISRTEMVASQDEFAKTASKQKTKDGEELKGYKNLMAKNQKMQIDRLVEEKKQWENNPGAEWVLVGVKEKRGTKESTRANAQETETKAIHVILKRQKRSSSSSTRRNSKTDKTDKTEKKRRSSSSSPPSRGQIVDLKAHSAGYGNSVYLGGNFVPPGSTVAGSNNTPPRHGPFPGGMQGFGGRPVDDHFQPPRPPMQNGPPQQMHNGPLQQMRNGPPPPMPNGPPRPMQNGPPMHGPPPPGPMHMNGPPSFDEFDEDGPIEIIEAPGMDSFGGDNGPPNHKPPAFFPPPPPSPPPAHPNMGPPRRAPMGGPKFPLMGPPKHPKDNGNGGNHNKFRDNEPVFYDDESSANSSVESPNFSRPGHRRDSMELISPISSAPTSHDFFPGGRKPSQLYGNDKHYALERRVSQRNGRDDHGRDRNRDRDRDHDRGFGGSSHSRKSSRRPRRRSGSSSGTDWEVIDAVRSSSARRLEEGNYRSHARSEAGGRRHRSRSPSHERSRIHDYGSDTSIDTRRDRDRSLDRLRDHSPHRYTESGRGGGRRDRDGRSGELCGPLTRRSTAPATVNMVKKELLELEYLKKLEKLEREERRQKENERFELDRRRRRGESTRRHGSSRHGGSQHGRSQWSDDDWDRF